MEETERNVKKDVTHNLVWHTMEISRKMREDHMKQKAFTIWMSGLSGAGKSTIANALEKRLYAMGKKTMLLDGDNVRMGLNSNLGFSDEDRNENIRRIGEIAALFRDAGIITLVSFISPFREMRRVARERVGEGNFVEVYVNTDLQTCMERDPKGLYKKQIKNFTGKDSGYEEPLAPELIADTKKYTAKECAEQIFDYIMM